jgi:hypothetical protein
MATYVGGTSTNLAGAGPFSLTALTGGVGSAPLPGDVVIATYGSRVVGSPSYKTLSGNNSGAYISLGDLFSNGTTYGICGTAFYHVMGATPDTTISLSASVNVTGVEVWRDLNTTTQIDVTTTTATGTGTDIPNPAAITPVTTNAIVLAIGISSDNTFTATPAAPSGYGNFIGNANVSATVAMATKDWSGSGSEDPGVFTGTYKNSTGLAWAAWTIALRPTTGVSINSLPVNVPVVGLASTIGVLWVLPSDVKSGVVYGPTGVEFTGTYVGGGGSGMSRSRVTNA